MAASQTGFTGFVLFSVAWRQLQGFCGVDGPTVAPELEMQVSAARGAGSTDAAESLAEGESALAGGQGGGDGAEMGIAGARAVGVLEFDHQPVRAGPAQHGDAAGGGGADPGAGGGGQVGAVVVMGAQRSGAGAEGGGDAGGPHWIEQGGRLLREGGRGEEEERKDDGVRQGRRRPLPGPPPLCGRGRGFRAGFQVLVAGWKVPMELPPSQETTAPVM